MISNESIELIKKHEGFRLVPYFDSAGHLTVGWGHNLEKKITAEQAERYLQHDLADVLDDCEKLDFYLSLDPARQVVVENMIFNLGLPGFLKFKKTIEYIRAQFYNYAADEMLDSKWARQVGDRALELSRIMATGEFE